MRNLETNKKHTQIKSKNCGQKGANYVELRTYYLLIMGATLQEMKEHRGPDKSPCKHKNTS